MHFAVRYGHVLIGKIFSTNYMLSKNVFEGSKRKFFKLLVKKVINYRHFVQTV